MRYQHPTMERWTMSWVNREAPPSVNTGFDRWGIWSWYIGGKDARVPKKIMFVSEEPVQIEMHSFKAGKSYGKMTCPVRYGVDKECPLCTDPDSSRQGSYYCYTVIDLDGYERDGVHQMKLMPFLAYQKTRALIDLEAAKFSKPSIQGAVFEVVRLVDGKKGSSQGDVWKYLGHDDVAQFSAKYTESLKSSLSYFPEEYGMIHPKTGALVARPIDFTKLLEPMKAEHMRQYLAMKGWVSPDQRRPQAQAWGQPQPAYGQPAYAPPAYAQPQAPAYAQQQAPTYAPPQAPPHAPNHNAGYGPPSAHPSKVAFDDEDIPF